jgi:glyoxylase-like metal-dependent hydrolase (beta-lactamase superfamily II)
MDLWSRLFRELNFPGFAFPMYRLFLRIADLWFHTREIKHLNVGAITDESSLDNVAGGIRPVITPGHSLGHVCFLYDNGDLFLGDVVPRTPWLDPGKRVLQQHIQSIEHLINLPSNKVQRAVHSHLNVKDRARAFYPWEEERERFRRNLDLIYETLDRIPLILKNRGVMTIRQLAPHVIRRVKPAYSDFITKTFIDPDGNWLSAYLEELQSRGAVQRSIQKRRVVWST